MRNMVETSPLLREPNIIYINCDGMLLTRRVHILQIYSRNNKDSIDSSTK